MLKGLFTDFLMVSLTMSIVILGLRMAAPWLKQNYAAKWRYWIWLLIAVRLVLPVNFSFNDSLIQIQVPENPLTAAGFQAAPAPIVQEDTSSAAVSPDRQTAEPGNRKLSLLSVLSLIWISGLVLFMLYHFSVYRLFRQQALRWSSSVQSKAARDRIESVFREMDIKPSFAVLTSGKVPNPMLVGIRKPLLLLPHENYGGQELEFIVRHELVHYKRHDILYKLLLLVVQAVHWFNPLVWLMVREAGRELEIYCDETVVHQQSLAYRKQYCEAILTAMQYKEGRGLALSTSFSGRKDSMKHRFMNILNMKKRRNGTVLFSIALLIAVIVGILAACTSVAVKDASKGQAVNEAIQAAEVYKTAEYNVQADGDILSAESVQQRNEELQPFFTEHFAQKAVDTRYTILPLQVADSQQLSVKPDNLHFSLSGQKKDNIELTYTLDLVLLDQEGQESDRVPLQGILTLFYVDEQWLVQGDRFDSAAFNKLIHP